MAEPAQPIPAESSIPAPIAVVPTKTVIADGPPTDIDPGWNGPPPILPSSSPIPAVETPIPLGVLDASGAVIIPGIVPPAGTSIPPPAASIDTSPSPEAMNAPVPIPSTTIPPGAVLSLALPPAAASTSTKPAPALSLINDPKVFSSAIDLKGNPGDLPPVLQDNDKPGTSSTSRRMPSATPKDLLLDVETPIKSSIRVASSSTDLRFDPATSQASTSTRSSTIDQTTSSTKDLLFDQPSSSIATGRTIWDLVGSSMTGTAIGTIKSDPYPGMLKISSNTASSAAIASSNSSSGIVAQSGGATDGQPVQSPASSAQPTLPPPGSPEESNVRAVISSSITLTGSMAVAAIKAGATQLDSTSGTEKVITEGEVGGLNGFAIAGIVGGGVLGLAILGLVWYKWRNKAKPKDDEPNMKESQPPDTAFSFSDDPVTASTGRFRRTIIDPDGSGPFDDRYRSQYGNEGRGTWYEQDHDQLHDQSGDHHRDDRDDLEELYGTAIEAEQARRQLQNPFEPPVPPIPSSTPRSIRPETGFTDIYGSYESRPTTQIQEPPSAAGLPYDMDDDRELPVQTPATSSLLPWLQKPRAAPPPPAPDLPETTRNITPSAISRSKGKRKADVPQDVDDERQYTRYESNAAGVGAAGMNQQRPARPVMAQTPAGAGENGFNVLIPGFR